MLEQTVRPLTCLRCEGKCFTAKTVPVTCNDQTEQCPCWVCDNCGTGVMDSDQMDVTLGMFRDDNGHV